mmetsp:Transcript_18782/g.46631  ORF Transcript_18782/g.46631 Transcript_18782/m.46631 type:complete len:224 (+) Transcript_18782:156-827(+)
MEASSEQQMSPPPPIPPQQEQVPIPPTQPASGRGRGGRGRGRGGGRMPTGGRSIVNVNQRNSGRGRGGPTQKVSANTGIPFGHVPAYLPGSSSLVEELDQRIMIVLRDGRHLVGNLRTFDQYSNLVLDEASERRFHSNDEKDGEKTVTYYADVPLGMYIVRGDSIVLLGQIDDYEEESSSNSVVIMKKVDNEAFEDLIAQGAEETGDEEGSQLEWDFDKDLLA